MMTWQEWLSVGVGLVAGYFVGYFHGKRKWRPGRGADGRFTKNADDQ
jgi:hypothetical protein